MLLEVRLHHCFSPCKSVSDPCVDCIDVGIVDVSAGSNSISSACSHESLSRGVLSLHGTFLLSDECGKIGSHLGTSVSNKLDISGSDGSGISLVVGNSSSEFCSGICNDGVECGNTILKHLLELVSVWVVGVSLVTGELIRDLSVSMWVWKSEVIKSSNTSEVVSWSVEGASSLSETGLVDIVAATVSEDMHRVDDVLSDSLDLVASFSLECSSGILEGSESGIHEGIEGIDCIFGESREGSGCGISEVLNLSVRAKSLYGNLFKHGALKGGILISHVGEHGILSSELSLGPVMELGHESVVLFSRPWGSITSGSGCGIEVVGVVVVDLFEESLHLCFIFFHGGSEFGHLVVEESVEGVSSSLDDVCHLSIVGSNIVDEGLSKGTDEDFEFKSLSSVEISFFGLPCSEVSFESSVGLSNSLVDGGLFLCEESEERESVV